MSAGELCHRPRRARRAVRHDVLRVLRTIGFRPRTRRSRASVSLSSAPDLPPATVARLPVYLRELNLLSRTGVEVVSSGALAEAVGVEPRPAPQGPLAPRLVRHPGCRLRRRGAAGSSSAARWAPRTSGRWSSSGSATWVAALAGYSGFSSRGFRIVALVDPNPELIGQRDQRDRDHRPRRPGARRRPHRGGDRRARHPRRGGAGGGRPAGAPGGHQHPQLRRERAHRAGPRHRTEGRSRSGAADPGLPRAAQVRRTRPRRSVGRRRTRQYRRRRHEHPGRQRLAQDDQRGRAVPGGHGSGHRDEAGPGAARRRPRRRGGRPLHLQPHRDVRLGLPLPRRPGRRHPDPGRPVRGRRSPSCARCVRSTSTRVPSPTPSRWPPVSTRWWSGRTRSSARSRRR